MHYVFVILKLPSISISPILWPVYTHFHIICQNGTRFLQTTFKWGTLQDQTLRYFAYLAWWTIVVACKTCRKKQETFPKYYLIISQCIFSICEKYYSSNNGLLLKYLHFYIMVPHKLGQFCLVNLVFNCTCPGPWYVSGEKYKQFRN